MKVAVTVVLFLVFVTHDTVGASDSKCTVLDDINGCSVPLRLPFPYKAQFTPACNSHDVCYRCVSVLSFFHRALYFLIK